MFNDNFNIEIHELKLANFKNMNDKLEGHKFTNIQFSELTAYVGCHINQPLDKIRLLNKSYDHQIENSHKVSEDDFITYFNQYNDYINNLKSKEIQT